MTTTPDEAVARLHESARRFNIELDEAETQRWLEAIAAETAPNDPSESGPDITVTEEGVFGHKVTMLDFSPAVIERFRRIGQLVDVKGPAGVVEGALAMSGSSTQSKIQAFPGDGDFFQRLNIKAATRLEACQILAKVLRDNAIERASGPTYQFIEAKWSLWPFDCVHNGEAQKKGGPISWLPAEVFAGEMFVERDGERVRIGWDELCEEPGWCKLDWVAVDADSGGLANASNVIDPTWESPDGEIVALDGYIDAYFQEVYLDQEELPTFAKIVANVSGDALDEYVEQLEGEVKKYLGHPNYGKVAKRMYNVFRYSGRHAEAAYVRELFDEPTVVLYQVWSLLWTLENAAVSDSTLPEEAVRKQADDLVMTVVQALEGVQEEEVVGALLRLRTALEANHEESDPELVERELEAAKVQLENVVNTFFHDRLVALPTIKEYIDALGVQPGSGGH